MPIISTVGRKRLSVRMLIVFIYIFCILGSVIFVYPFLLMVASSTTNAVDTENYDLIPKYYYQDYELFKKFLNLKYVDRFRGGEKNIDPLNTRYKTDFIAYKDIDIKVPAIKNENIRTQVNDFNAFIGALPEEFWTRAFNYNMLKEYKKFAKTRYKTIHDLNKAYSESLDSFEFLLFPYDDPIVRTWSPAEDTKWNDIEFKKSLPAKYRLLVAADKKYTDYLKLKYQEIEKLNKEYGTTYKDFNEIRLAKTVPRNRTAASDWEFFVRQKFPFRFISLSGCEADYGEFLRKQYGSVSRLNKYYKTNYSSWAEVKLFKTEPKEAGPVKLDWRNFLIKDVPVRSLQIDSGEQRYYAFLEEKYKDISALNAAYGAEYKGFEELQIPFAAVDYTDFHSRRQSLRFGFIFSNYFDVLDFMLINGRATVNTVILVVAMLLTCLTVNPLCAYALSRYNLTYTYKILLFLLATMAFPAEVGMIPSFLLLKNLNMLNTFWALILPGMASGYNIFILKGFFDSLPKELYESAMMDGATERQMFTHITLPLSTPVFAVIALWTFVGTYGGFMWAFIICQNPKMWTIMVTLYQYQQANPTHLVMAALVFAAIPILLVFAFAQNMIMKGIILPVEK